MFTSFSECILYNPNINIECEEETWEEESVGNPSNCKSASPVNLIANPLRSF